MERRIRELIRIYNRAYIELLLKIAGKDARGDITTFERALLADIRRILAELDDEAQTWVDENVRRAYQTGQEEAAKAYAEARGEAPIEVTFVGIHKEAVAVLAANMADDLTEAHQFVGRRVQDVIRSVGIQTIANKIATGKTVDQAKQRLVIALEEHGVSAFRDSRGRFWRLDKYAETVIRSGVAEAQNLGTMNQLQYDLDHDLVQMTGHRGACPICAPYENRIYSISGRDSRYPPLRGTAFGEFANIHPNCRHRLTPYFEDLADNPAEDREFSNRPFDIDPRSQREREAYEKAQEKKREMREIRRQWERYKARMPDEVPNFATFVRIKRANSKRYQELQRMFREAGRNQ